MRRLALVLLFVPTISWAGEDLKKASQMLDRMSFQRALKTTQRVLASPDLQPQDLVEAYRIEGLCLSALGRKKEARMSFQKLLTINPEFKLSRDISPKLVRPFRRAASKKHKPAPILLVHHPPETGAKLGGQVIQAVVDTDDLGLVAGVRLRFRLVDGQEQSITVPAEGPGIVSLRLPDPVVAGYIEYYIEGLNQVGSVLTRVGSPDQPFRLETSMPTISLVPRVTKPAPMEEMDRPTPWYKTWWFWTAVGIVVVGGAAAALALSQDGSGDTTGYEIRFR